jgi:hypothetical protein
MHYKLKIVPSVKLAVRHKIEDLLRAEGYHIIGGGTDLVHSASDISFKDEMIEDDIAHIHFNHV